MPVITVTLIEGYDELTRKRLAKALTNAARGVIAAPAEGVTVITNEVPASNYMRAGRSRIPGCATVDPVDLVRRYLSLMEERDLVGASGMLHSQVELIFPGNQRFTNLQALVDWSKSRYRFIKKTFERSDQAMTEDGVTVIFQGTLSGEFPDGTTFADIRFIDWFLVEDGLIRQQRVWNDLDAVRPV